MMDSPTFKMTLTWGASALTFCLPGEKPTLPITLDTLVPAISGVAQECRHDTPPQLIRMETSPLSENHEAKGLSLEADRLVV